MDSDSCIYKILSLIRGKTQDFGANRDFFSKFSLLSLLLTIIYIDHTRFQNFKRKGSPRTQNTRYIGGIEANFVLNEYKHWYQLKDDLIGSFHFMKKYALFFEVFYYKVTKYRILPAKIANYLF